LAIWGGIEGSGDGQFSYPEDVEVGPSGFVYVLERGNYRIQKFNASGGFVKKWGFLCVLPGDCDGGFSVPLSFALDVQENVYVVEWNHRVQKFDSEGNFISKWGTLGTGPGQFDHPNAICVDPSGDAYVGDRYGVQRFDADGNFILQLVRSDSPVYGVGSLAADQSGIIYVGDTERVRLYTRDGAFLLDWDGSDVPPVEDCLRDLPTRASKRESRTSSRLALLDIAFDSGQYIYATHQWGVLKFVRGPTPVTSTSWTAIKKAYRE
jgi:streptogramin lyase